MGNQTSLSLSQNSPKMIYILKLEEGKYYIGKTNSLADRYRQHNEGTGSKWTAKYKPINIIDTHPGDGYDEDMYTKRYMSLYGIDNVRGGSYCTIDLSQETIFHLEREIWSAENKCLGCGSDKHIVKDCNGNKNGNTSANHCDRCDRIGHTIDKCFANTKLDGTSLPNNYRCYKCGDLGHFKAQCTKNRI